LNISPEQRKALRESDPFDSRNVLPIFKNIPTETLQEYMNEIAVPFVAICQNLVGDFNVAQIIRSANVFGLESVVLAGRKQYDKRGTVGAHHYIKVFFESDIKVSIAAYRELGYRIVAAEFTIEPIHLDKNHSLTEYHWNERTAVIFGEEGLGLSSDVLNLADDIVYIPQRGTVRSLNVAGAAQIFMYDYTTKVGHK
jgi:tRNA G18 (ribose-2'-O)-methylase SpoU